MGGFQDQQIFVMIRKVQDDGVHRQTTTLVASHSLKDCQCTHTNTMKVISIENQKEYLTPEITASFSEQFHNVITRTTEVKYLKTKYIVLDRYVFDYKAERVDQLKEILSSQSPSDQKPKQDDQSMKIENSEESNKYKKLCFFHKRLTNGKTLLKRNTKNLPKNFFKGFLNFIQARNLNQNSGQILRQLKGLSEGAKYNNILIQKLLSNSTIAPYFRQFLENHAEGWINGSKINDKLIHIEAIPIYLSLFDKFAYAEDNYWSDQ